MRCMIKMNKKSNDKKKKKNQTNIDFIDYFLIGIGTLLLPVYLVGLIFFGIFLWRLGNKWEKHDEQLEKDLHEKYDIDYISDDMLEEMK